MIVQQQEKESVMRRSGIKKGKGGLQNARKGQEQKKLMCRPQPLPVIPVTVMQNAQNVDLHTKALIVMVWCGSVVIIVSFVMYRCLWC